SFVFIPAKDFHGFVTFTYRATDGVSESEPTVVTIEILPVNDAPVAGKDAATVVAGGSVTIDVLANDHDVDGDPLQPVLVAGPSVGTLTLDAAQGTFMYQAPPGYSGVVSFTYRSSDGRVLSKVVTVEITVLPSESQSGNDNP